MSVPTTPLSPAVRQLMCTMHVQFIFPYSQGHDNLILMQLTDLSTTSTAPRLGSTAVEFPCILVTKLVWNATNMGTEVSNH